MKTPTNNILTLNGGSSSIKFSFYKKEESLQQLFYGEMENIGLDDTRISCINRVRGEKYTAGVKAVDHAVAATVITDWLERQKGFGPVKAIGHRKAEPCRVQSSRQSRIRPAGYFGDKP